MTLTVVVGMLCKSSLREDSSHRSFLSACCHGKAKLKILSEYHSNYMGELFESMKSVTFEFPLRGRMFYGEILKTATHEKLIVFFN